MIQIIPLNESRSLVPVPDLKLSSLEEEMRRKLHYHHLAREFSRDTINKLIKINSNGILAVFKVITDEENSYSEDDDTAKPKVEILNLGPWKGEYKPRGAIISNSGILNTSYVDIDEIHALERDGEFTSRIVDLEPDQSLYWHKKFNLFYSCTCASSSKPLKRNSITEVSSTLSIAFENLNPEYIPEQCSTAFSIKIDVSFW